MEHGTSWRGLAGLVLVVLVVLMAGAILFAQLRLSNNYSCVFTRIRYFVLPLLPFLFSATHRPTRQLCLPFAVAVWIF